MKSFELLHEAAQYENAFNKKKGKNVSVVTIIPRHGSSSSRSASRDGKELKKQVNS